MVNIPLEISHSWGNPREPEYRNNARVSFVRYKEGENHLYFSMYPLEIEGGKSVVVEVPSDIRAQFGNDWGRCQIAVERVVNFLKSLDESIVHRSYATLVVDTSKVPKWLPVQIKLFEEKHTFLCDSFPTAETSPFIAIGLATICFKEWLIGVGFTATNEVLFAIGFVTLGMLLIDIGKRWMFFRNPSFVVLRGWTLLDKLSGTFKRYGRRYVITLCLSLLIISAGLS